MAATQTPFSDAFQELRLPAAGVELAACLWHPQAPQAAFALHGWLDNAASMAPLANQLSQLQIVVPDLAGHGRSDFRSADANYDLTRDVADLYALAEHLTWSKFGLIGHSRGAMIAVLFAAAFPDKVKYLVLIDGGAPHRLSARERPEKLARAIREQALLAQKTGSLFKDRETALRARAHGFVPVEHDIAELLASRALIQEAEGYRWRADQRLKAASANPLETATIEAFYAAIRCPVLQIIATDGLAHEGSDYAGPVERITDFERRVLEGDHHLHISRSAQVAAAISAWLAAKTP